MIEDLIKDLSYAEMRKLQKSVALKWAKAQASKGMNSMDTARSCGCPQATIHRLVEAAGAQFQRKYGGQYRSST